MEKITLMLSDDFINYKPLNNIKTSLWYLINFFDNISCESINSYITWALDSTALEIGAGNTASLIKKNNNIYIGFIYSDEEDINPYFTLSIPEFVTALTQWEKLVKSKTVKIVITNNNGILSIEKE